MTESTRFTWVREHARVLLPAAGLLFVAGVTFGIVGVMTAAGADDDLAAAETELASAQDRLAEAEDEADAAVSRLEAIRPEAEAMFAEADVLAADARDLCDCGEEQAALAPQAIQAILDRNADEYNRLTEELNSWADRANALIDEINQAAPAVLGTAD